MKIFKRKVIKGTNWALAGLLTVLGFGCSNNNFLVDDEVIYDYNKESSSEEKEIVVAYGVPHASYKLKGTVMNEDGKALEGIRVIVPEINNCTKIFEQNIRREERNDTLITDQEGAYNYEVSWWMPQDSLQIKLKIEDPAGKYETKNDSVKYSFSDLNDGDGSSWLVGTASKVKDFFLKLKNHE